MKQKYEFLELLEDKVVYKINDISLFTPSLINKIDFKGLKKCIIFSEVKIKNEWSLSKYNFRNKSISIIYSINKNDLKSNALPEDKRFRPVTLGQSDFLDFYYDTKREFYNHYRDKIKGRFWEEYGFVVSKLLLKGRHVCVLNTVGEKVGLLSMITWRDVFNKPVSWINWVWISKKVEKRDKIYLQDIFKDWIKKNAIYQRVQCLVNLFNIPSQKFFNKLGFNPECLNILKLSD